MQANCWQFRLPWRYSGTMQGISPDGAHPGLHSMPLNAAIGPEAAMVKEFESNTQNTNKTQLLASNYSTF